MKVIEINVDKDFCDPWTKSISVRICMNAGISPGKLEIPAMGLLEHVDRGHHILYVSY